MKTKVYNLVILDASGSMCVIREQAISGVNETIQSIRNAQEENSEQEHYFSFVSFNNRVKTIYDCVPIAQAQEITPNEYRPDAMTALLDAMGISLLALESKVAPEDKVLVTIITDGMENASCEFSRETIKSLVDKFKEKGWVFAYIGANQNVMEVADSLSIKNAMAFESTKQGTVYMMQELNDRRKKFYGRINLYFDSAEENESFFDK